MAVWLSKTSLSIRFSEKELNFCEISCSLISGMGWDYASLQRSSAESSTFGSVGAGKAKPLMPTQKQECVNRLLLSAQQTNRSTSTGALKG